jgi:hypothetical protein
MSPVAREHSFDELTRGLASGSISRGKALRLMGAALVGGTLASLGIDGEAGAAPPGCKRAGKNCTRDTQCCGSLVCPSGTCQTPCPTGGSCETGFSFGCQNSDNCFCTTTPEGTTFCTEAILCDSAVTCTSSQDCPSGWVCSDTCCDGRSICNPPCGTIPGGAASSAENQGMSGH